MGGDVGVGRKVATGAKVGFAGCVLPAGSAPVPCCWGVSVVCSPVDTAEAVAVSADGIAAALVGWPTCGGAEHA